MTFSRLGGSAAVFLFSFLLANAVMAQQVHSATEQDHTQDTDHDHEVLEEILVQASPLLLESEEMAQSTTVLRGEALERAASNNIGDTLSILPGVANASFGQNVGRPVIRGQQGFRVGVLNDNMTSSDAAALSQDHGVPSEPFMADQVEVLRGPATLIYGSATIGGVVNIVNGAIPESVPDGGLEGRAILQGDSAADQEFGAARLDFGSGSFAGHVSAFYRRSDDYEIPGRAELFEEDDHDEDEHGHEEDEVFGILENSFLDNEGGSFGGSWIGETWRAGLSYTAYDSKYGIPGGHGHGEEEEEHEDEHEQGEHGHEGEEDEIVTIDMENRRLDALLVGDQPFDGIERLKLNLTHTDYTHTEFEGDEVGTFFAGDTMDSRLELRHEPWAEWTGAFGVQYTDREFLAEGEEAFVPPSDTSTTALFWVETGEFGDWRVDLGVRFESIDISSFELEGHGHDEEEQHEDEHEEEALEPIDRDFDLFSFSSAATYHLDERSHLTFTFANAERAPSDVELFANGPHIATQTFEVGNPDLRVETNRHFAASYRVHQGALTGSLTVYLDDYDDFIYQADTGEEEDGFPERIWSQQDAKFVGTEVELRYDLGDNRAGHWQLFGFYDRVRAELDDGSNVPRIPPRRIGLGLNWDHHAWAGNLLWVNASDQNRTSEFENPTPGYDLVNAEISYLLPITDQGIEIFVKGKNLLDEDIRNSTSFLKDQAPQIGRNFVFGARARF
ncbi:MAG: TonB-dependent receptor [Xanthomonadales bacterium]|nr:TonB-dependent receptor [Xanthomonadales bacterium]